MEFRRQLSRSVGARHSRKRRDRWLVYTQNELAAQTRIGSPGPGSHLCTRLPFLLPSLSLQTFFTPPSLSLSLLLPLFLFSFLFLVATPAWATVAALHQVPRSSPAPSSHQVRVPFCSLRFLCLP